MVEITDEYMKEEGKKVKPYTLAIIHFPNKAEKVKDPEIYKIVWEHGRNNYKLMAEGKLLIVCPVRDESDLAGIGVFSTDLEETKKIANGDPAVKAGIMTWEFHQTMTFPNQSLSR